MSGPTLRYRLQAMSRGVILAMMSVAALALAIPAAAGAGVSPVKESDSPFADQGASYDYRSNITSIVPRVPGLSVEVLEFADRLLLRNHTGKTVTIYGYEGEPYARVLANGTAEQNANAPATYLNTNFYADVTVPSFATPTATPKWEVVDRTGEFEWHDHRIPWMSPIPPAKVTDKSKRTWIFDWQVPITVGAAKGAIDGQLFWTPENSNAPLALIVLGVVIVIGGLVFVVYVRRRRARVAPAAGVRAGASAASAPPSEEAW